ncbi:dipeptidyl aminopeptidase/acylaminoacyl peptidase [Pseudomonas chlororaphis subsp. aurantiaca]|uniref:hypothetical protein n=1 Tax=Pseudomonas chlororaphis TaxID=587753 RepID=UPI000864C8D1|nr:hypothetical protein [Pseudomonas chlororaphis]BAV74118.1 dipeptidyl aminopeptidase/acylaminoacyl peptidase [Pseudomonas chlororaphis subsp. aurantiaca]
MSNHPNRAKFEAVLSAATFEEMRNQYEAAIVKMESEWVPQRGVTPPHLRFRSFEKHMLRVVTGVVEEDSPTDPQTVSINPDYHVCASVAWDRIVPKTQRHNWTNMHPVSVGAAELSYDPETRRHYVFCLVDGQPVAMTVEEAYRGGYREFVWPDN